TQGIVDHALALRGLKRNVVCTVPAFSSVPVALRRIAAVATVPRVLAESWRDDFGLEVAELPVALPEIQVAMVSHQNRNSDSAVQWLGNLIKAIAQPRI
ncbi:LysR substrate-binding domain-containing protein, partial [Acidovorax cavernicola]